MPAKHGNMICPLCGKFGSLSKRRVKDKGPLFLMGTPSRNSLKEDISTLPDAFGYAAKVFFHQSQLVRKFPYADDNKDISFAKALYSGFMELSPHTPNEIREFETKCYRSPIAKRISYAKRGVLSSRKGENTSKEYFLENIKTEPIHTEYPENAGILTRTSIAYLYISIICMLVRHFLIMHPIGGEMEREVANSVYSFFNLFNIDERYRKAPLDYFKVMLDTIRYGYNAAGSLNSTILDDGRHVNLSPKNLKKMQNKMYQKALDIVYASPIIKNFFNFYGNYIRTHSKEKKEILEMFTAFETITLLNMRESYEYIYFKHYDSTIYKKEKENHVNGGRNSKAYGTKWCGPLKNHELF